MLQAFDLSPEVAYTVVQCLYALEAEFLTLSLPKILND